MILQSCVRRRFRDMVLSRLESDDSEIKKFKPIKFKIIVAVTAGMFTARTPAKLGAGSAWRPGSV